MNILFTKLISHIDADADMILFYKALSLQA